MILVVGASGDLGSRICSHLARAGVKISALARSSERAAQFEVKDLRAVVGDLADGHGLDGACSGVETIVCSATAIGRRLGGERGASIYEVDDRGVGRLIEAWRCASCRQRIQSLVLSSVSVSCSTPSRADGMMRRCDSVESSPGRRRDSSRIRCLHQADRSGELP